MKLLERTENLVYEFTQRELQAALIRTLGLSPEYRLEAIEIRENQPEAYAHVIIARNIDTP